MSRQGFVCAFFALVVSVLGSRCIEGAVSSTGEVIPNPPGEGDLVFVGGQGYGDLTIDAASVLSLNSLNVGVQSLGIVKVEGPGSVLEVAITAIVGDYAGVGMLSIENGARAKFSQLRVNFVEGAAQGIVNVDGAGSLLEVDSVTLLGEGGFGELNLTGGAVAFLEGGVTIHPFATARVQGPGTVLSVRRDFDLQGTLRVEDAAAVHIAETNAQITGTLELAGGAILAETLATIEGSIVGEGQLNWFSGELFNLGSIEAGPGQTLELRNTDRRGEIRNEGDILVEGGAISFDSRLHNLSTIGGQITLNDGELRFLDAQQSTIGLQNRSVLNAIGGENHIYGGVDNANGASITVLNESTLFFHDLVSNLGKISVMPGAKAVFLDDLVMIDSAELLATITGTGESGENGVAEVAGEVDFVNPTAVSVALAGGYQPGFGESFQILHATGGVTGEPALGDVPTLEEGLAWDLVVEPNALVLTVVSSLAGDFNADGVVDSADYAVWRSALGASDEGLLASNGDASGEVDQGDYQLWRENYGQSIATLAAGQSAAIPEPGALWLILAGLVSIGATRR